MKSKKRNLFLDYLLIFVIGFILLYPIIWMFFSTFKTNEEIFGFLQIAAELISLSILYRRMEGKRKIYLCKVLCHTALMVIPTDITDSIVGDFCGLWLCKI